MSVSRRSYTGVVWNGRVARFNCPGGCHHTTLLVTAGGTEQPHVVPPRKTGLGGFLGASGVKSTEDAKPSSVARPLAHSLLSPWPSVASVVRFFSATSAVRLGLSGANDGEIHEERRLACVLRSFKMASGTMIAPIAPGSHQYCVS